MKYLRVLGFWSVVLLWFMVFWGVAIVNVTYGSSKRSINFGVSGVANPIVKQSKISRWKGDYIYYGSYSQSASESFGDVYYHLDPIKWQVLDTRDRAVDRNSSESDHSDGVLLLSDKIIEEMPDGWNNEQCIYLADDRDIFKDFLNSAFSKVEITAIKDGNYSSILGGTSKIFLLSRASVANPNYGFLRSEIMRSTSRVGEVTDYVKSLGNDKTYLDAWWLEPSDNMLNFVDSAGSLSKIELSRVGSMPIPLMGFRPALNLDLAAVVFTSVALDANGKYSEVVSDFNQLGATQELTTVNNEWKITVRSHLLNAPTIEDIKVSGNVLSFSYQDLPVGLHNYLSSIITKISEENGEREILYYGKLASAVQVGRGKVKVVLPSDFDRERYEISVFAEEVNGDYYTDYVSSLITIDFEKLKAIVEEPGETMIGETRLDGNSEDLEKPSEQMLGNGDDASGVIATGTAVGLGLLGMIVGFAL